jgi:integrase
MVVTDTRVLVWVRPSTVCWSPPRCWTPKAVDHVHDMRHSFAVQALMRWYRDGADVQSNLPRLAIYMGHVSIVSTAHYLHFVPAMRQLASDRFEVAFGHVVGEVSA